jgi:hypothetical protein
MVLADGVNQGICSAMPLFVPANFEAPAGLETPAFRIRPSSSFADTVRDLDENERLTGLYVNPSDLAGHDAGVFCWIHASRATSSRRNER